MMPPGVAVRVGAAQAVQRIREGASLKAVLAQALPTFGDARDRALLEALVFETCRWMLRYQPVLQGFLERPLPKRQQVVECLVLTGMAQLDAMAMPGHAVLTPSVEAVRALKLPAMAGLVNALLRRFQRECPDLQRRWADNPQASSAHPEWLLRSLQQDWPDQTAAIVEANNTPAPMWLRVNPRHHPVATYAEALAGAGIAVEPSGRVAGALMLARRIPPTQLPGWQQGWVSVQDAAAQLAAHALDLSDGLRVLDACAAPGGKAAAALEVHALDLWALDSQPERVASLRATLARLGLVARVDCADAAEPAAWWDGRPFDRILLDAPCSASGIIRRQPDIKLHRRAEDIPALSAQQHRLIHALWPLLKPRGRLLYATCSVLRAENHLQIAGFLDAHADARLVELPCAFGRSSAYGSQILPGEDGLDGFFYAALEKQG